MKIEHHVGGETFGAKEPYPAAAHVVSEAPACSCGACSIVGGSVVLENDTASARAYCASCRAPRGRIVVTTGSLFGIEEDQRVLGGPWKIF